MNNLEQVDKVLRVQDVTQMTGLSKASVYRLIKLSDFPKQFKLGSRAIGWRMSSVKAWIDNRASQND